ncbi:MAG TPA: metal ABC transporter ATP-binding protein [Anaerolineales bacterium]|nr:metal ABC transporter ATP-binding protein [Anaerolineales bacterium]
MTMAYARIPEHVASAAPVQLEAVSVAYNGKLALKEISFSLAAGDSVAVVGPNGAGKTTLFRTIAGAMQPSKGAVRVYGHEPGGHICIAYVPQRSEVAWDFPVTVQDVVMMGRIRKIGLFRWPRRKDWQFIRQSMRSVGVDGLADRQIAELSGGQQQKVFLAQAIAQEAELVLLDEPLGGLDLPSQEAIFEILEQLKGQRVSVLVATHDLNLAAERFDRVMLLNRRMIAMGTPDQVLTQSNLVQAYGGHLHPVQGESGMLVLTDTCCEGEEQPEFE